MKPYGNTPYQNQTCRYGCCTAGTVKTKHRLVAVALLRRSRKAARRQGRKAAEG